LHGGLSPLRGNLIIRLKIREKRIFQPNLWHLLAKPGTHSGTCSPKIPSARAAK